MRVCPKCKHIDPPYWRRSFHGNPGGEIDIAHINDLEFNRPKLADWLKNNRGKAFLEDPFAYFLGKRTIYVKRIWIRLYEQGGVHAFNIPYEKRRKYSESKRSQQLSKYFGEAHS